MTRTRDFRLRVLRLMRLGLMQKTIATRLGVVESTVGRWLTVENTSPRADHLDLFDAFLADLRTEIEMNYEKLAKDDLDRIEAEAEAFYAGRVIRRKERRRARHIQERRRKRSA